MNRAQAVLVITLSLIVLPSIAVLVDNNVEVFGDVKYREIVRELRLNEDQKKKWGDLERQLLTAKAVVESQRIQTGRDVLKILDDSRLDQKKVVLLTSRYIQLVRSNMHPISTTFAEFYDALNDAQRKILRSRIESWMEGEEESAGGLFTRFVE